MTLAPLIGSFALGVLTAWGYLRILPHLVPRDVEAADGRKPPVSGPAAGKPPGAVPPQDGKPRAAPDRPMLRVLSVAEVEALDRRKILDTLRPTLEGWKARLQVEPARKFALFMRAGANETTWGKCLKRAERLRRELASGSASTNLVIVVGRACEGGDPEKRAAGARFALVENVFDGRDCEQER